MSIIMKDQISANERMTLSKEQAYELRQKVISEKIIDINAVKEVLKKKKTSLAQDINTLPIRWF